MKTVSILLYALVSAVTTAAAHAAGPSYLDDRSTAAALVKSFYNAINLHEYARAYSYFAPGAAPKPYPDFVAGYANTASVRLITGHSQSEGAAGSTYTTIAVAIDAMTSAGKHSQFAGCYTTRLINPGIQDPPVTPMVIASAKLHAAHGDIGSLLGNCAAN